jgi:hypothetical protein
MSPSKRGAYGSRVPLGYRHEATVEWTGEVVTVRSTLELDVLKDLNARGIAFDYERDRLAYEVKRFYTPDFNIRTASGGEIHIEAKGWFKPADRSKALAVRKENPDVDIRFLFSSPNTKIAKGSKTSNAGWCNLHGFLWCAHVVPQEWLDE